MRQARIGQKDSFTAGRLQTYRLYGLDIASEFRLPGPVVVHGESGHDLTFELGEARVVSQEPGDGEFLAVLNQGAGRGYSLIRSGDGFLLRVFGLCEFQIDLGPARVRAHLDPSCDPDFLSLFASGNLMASILGLRAEPVLHAGAAAFQGNVVAVAGGPGSGKSTLTGLMCAAQGEFVADDLLRLDTADGRVCCHAGAAELRLRPQNAWLSGHLAGRSRQTADGRTAVEMDVVTGLKRLAAIVFPRPSRMLPTMSVTRLQPKQAVISLLESPRIGGWVDPGVLKRHLEYAGEVARRVPVFSADIPWGPPFAPEVTGQLAALAETPTA